MGLRVGLVRSGLYGIGKGWRISWPGETDIVGTHFACYGPGGLEGNVAARLNKKILCFVDEHGTAGAGEFYLGAVFVFAREAGAIDKRFSDLLPATAKEIRASRLEGRYVHSLLARLVPRNDFLMLNRKHALRVPSPPRLYAQALIETVKVGIKRFRAEIAHLPRVGNIEVIVDANHQNTHYEFAEEIDRAKASGGVFRGVTRVAPIDSAASRLLQLADLVAYSRSWHTSGDFTADAIRQQFGVRVLSETPKGGHGGPPFGKTSDLQPGLGAAG